MVKNVVKKFGFTLLELIFAIVIIGIAVLSLPTMTGVTSNALESSLAQEAIYAASEELNKVLSFQWDSNSYDAGASFSSVININADCNTTRTSLRPGHIDQPKHRKCLKNPATTTANAVNALNPIFLEDTVHGAAPICTILNADGYKQNYNSQVTVTDLAAVGFIGVKQVTVAMTLNGNAVVNLSAFACNIGEIDYHHRTY